MDLTKLSRYQLDILEKVAKDAERRGLNPDFVLSRNQLDIAEKVAKEAERQGLNPDFVLPMVMAESGFNPKAVSSKGALGVMQLMPNTAKGLNVDPNDVDQNIRGGVSFIKKLIENKNIGNDPYKVLMGYNAGPNTTFFRTGKVEDLPTETLNYIDRISEIFGGNLPNPRPLASAEKPPEAAAPIAGVAVPGINQSAFTGPSEAGQSIITVPTVGDVIAGAEPGSTVGGGTTEETKEKVDQSFRAPAAMAGAILGASGTAGLEAGARIYGALKSIGTPEVSPAAQQRVGLQSWLNNLLSHEGKRVNLPLEKLEELVGKKINTMGELGEAYKTIAPTPAERIPKTTSIDPKTGVAKQVFRTVPGKPGIDLAPYAVSNARAAVQDAVSTISRGTSNIATPALRVGVGGLGGATAALSAYDASKLFERLKKQYDAKEEISLKDVARLGTKGLATVGGLASIIPHPAAQATGLALQAPETALSAYDLYQEALKNQSALNSAIPVMSDEEASRPAFRYPRALPRRNP